MRKPLLFILFAMLSMQLFAQNQLTLKIHHSVGNEEFNMNQEYTHDELNYKFSLTRLQYYVSQIEIIHDGGLSTEITDFWLLVNAGEEAVFNLGMQDVDQVEELRFWIGIEPAYNHLDPSTYAEGHPLALQDPSMHWGWAAGYRFSAVEGKTGPGLVLTYQLHSLGDDNYFQVELPTASLENGNERIVEIKADYLGLFKDINVSGGLISHGETGEAALLLQNFSTEVFSQLQYTGVDAIDNISSFILTPNPAQINQSRVMISTSKFASLRLQITDMSGRILREERIENQTSLDLNIKDAGVYLVKLFSNNSLLETRKLIITQ